MTIRVAINGFGRIGRACLPHPRRVHRLGHRGGRDQRPLRRRRPRLPAQVRHRDGRLRARRSTVDDASACTVGHTGAIADDERDGPAHRRGGSSASTSWSSRPASSRDTAVAAEAPRRRRQAGDPHRAAQGQDRRHDRDRRQRRRSSSPSTGWSPTPRAPPTAWRRSPRCSTSASASTRAS